jgi:hypothetical protein
MQRLLTGRGVAAAPTISVTPTAVLMKPVLPIDSEGSNV